MSLPAGLRGVTMAIQRDAAHEVAIENSRPNLFHVPDLACGCHGISVSDGCASAVNQSAGSGSVLTRLVRSVGRRRRLSRPASTHRICSNWSVSESNHKLICCGSTDSRPRCSATKCRTGSRLWTGPCAKTTVGCVGPARDCGRPDALDPLAPASRPECPGIVSAASRGPADHRLLPRVNRLRPDDWIPRRSYAPASCHWAREDQVPGSCVRLH